MTPTRNRAIPAPWVTMMQWLTEKLPDHVPVADMVARAEFVYEDGVPLQPSDPFRHHTFIWFHREVGFEPEVPGQIHVIYQDERLLVVDKPPFLATMPRGAHARQSALVKLRHELGLPDLTPMHRLDRLTSGLLAFTVQRHLRGTYQTLFDKGFVMRTYRALAPLSAELTFPLTVRNHLEKQPGTLQTQVVAGRAPNAKTLIEFEGEKDGLGIYRLSPQTGKTHQLRVHLAGLGLPIEGDSLYPKVRHVEPDDFTTPLQLLASNLSFTDPVSGVRHDFESLRSLPLLCPQTSHVVRVKDRQIRGVP